LIRLCIILLCFTAINTASLAFVENEGRREAPNHIRRERGVARSPVAAEIDNNLLTKKQQLIFGTVVLNHRFNMLREEGYTHFLRELLRVTEFSANEAVQIISQYRNNPQRWLAYLQEIREILLATGTENEQ